MDVRQFIRQWSTPITLVVLLVVLCLGVLWGYKTLTAKTGPEPTPCETAQMTVLEPGSVTINVYNGGSKRGLAGRIAAKLGEAGFVVDSVRNKDAKVLTVSVVGAAVDSPEVQLVAGFFTDPQIEGDGRVDHSVDIIVGNSFDERKGYIEEPALSINVPSGTVCLPVASPTETPSEPAVGDATTPTDQPT